ncbi:L,D-transpeptidase family protein [Nocardioides dongxiaopingii]|uniref:L,D-transpeptidase family protein n=1 Tax=Nocardioides sp. S-1144 TaxID=2582905 RepID=UPI00110DDA8A|nr:L,D-transpeptidase family protein [Nocardioides sp. S-1144]QCW49736.1 L,D-transpeptidase family protein [Nocardioides sp. S-1144]
MKIARRLVLTALVCALLALAAHGAGWTPQLGSDDDAAASTSPRDPSSSQAAPDGADPDTSPTTPGDDPADPTAPAAPGGAGDPAGPSEEPGAPGTDQGGTPSPSQAPSQAPSEEPSEEPRAPELQPGPALMGPGDDSDEVRELQARLRQIDWFQQDVTGTYGDVTRAAVEGFQAKREIPVTGEVDQRTMDRLLAMTSEPTAAELANQLGANVPGALDPRCTTGRALCVDKSSRTLRWVVDGQVLKTVDVRFGSDELPTREGAFSVAFKNRDHVSSLYDTPMPFAMFFSGGQAVHYSPDFAATGYNGASHGCVNVRDLGAITWLFDQVQVGDKVVVYWS